jgi:APA family basic amino acid/polyamine antiporter
MTIAGPRVYYALGNDYPLFAFLSRANPRTGAPVAALLVQGIVTSGVLLLGRVDQIQQYSGFTLTLFASLAISCVIVRRVRQPELPRPFKVFAYPLTPLLFLGVSLWMMFWALRGRPLESLLALATVGLGGVLFFLTNRRSRRA